jgi:F0F1-type ATP synthase assembly protein I
VAGLVFVLLYGMGNGMLTIVKGTAVAQYVNREHVASLNGALGVPQAISRAIAPLLLGVLWSREAGYRWGLLVLLAVGIVAAAALAFAQRRSLMPR